MKTQPKHILKLSKRLRQVDQMVTGHYDHLWDCCCDHGLLGCALLSREAADNIHFVDIVPTLMFDLENKLKRFYTESNSAWKTHCHDVAMLPIEQYDGTHLVVIAGVGGDLMIQFIEAILNKHKNVTIEFLLCPVHHQFSLRQKLIALDCSLIGEALVEDNQRFYEVIHVSNINNEHNKISPVGETIWRSSSVEQAEVITKYLAKTLNHYLRIQQGYKQKVEVKKLNEVQRIIDAYNAVSHKIK